MIDAILLKIPFKRGEKDRGKEEGKEGKEGRKKI